MAEPGTWDIVIIGGGNVAHYWARQFHSGGHRLLQIVNRTPQEVEQLAEHCEAKAIGMEGEVMTADLYLIAVSDDAIEQVAVQLALPEKAIVAHTSGMTPLYLLSSIASHAAVVYPLQSISKGRPLPPKRVPVFLHTADKETVNQLQTLFTALNHPVEVVSSTEQLQTLHLAAVFTNNFTNHLLAIARKLLQSQQLSFEHFYPILEETINKAKELSPQAAQTGPAVRGDRDTIDKHLDLLKKYPRYAQVYRDMTYSIEAGREKKEKNSKSSSSHYLQRLHGITTFIFDLDGVLTDGKGVVTAQKKVLRHLNAKDAYALQWASKQDYKIIVLSGAAPVGVEHRLKKMGVHHIFTQSADKLTVYQKLCKEVGIQDKEVVYMADDRTDLPLFEHVGVATCPHDAAAELFKYAHYISPHNGGHGAARDIIEQVLRLQGKWSADGAHIW